LVHTKFTKKSADYQGDSGLFKPGSSEWLILFIRSPGEEKCSKNECFVT